MCTLTTTWARQVASGWESVSVTGASSHFRVTCSRSRLTSSRLGIDAPAEFNYREVVRQWRTAGEVDRPRPVTQHPLWPEWSVFQGRAAAAFMLELRELAATTAGRPVPIGANAGLLWPRHLADYLAIDLFSAETDHHASGEQFTDLPLVAYRMADAVERPYAATASGGDWAYIKDKQLPGLVRGWVALAYAAGHCFMAPHRQWCYTPEKGTHWYSGRADQFAPLYRFVRANAQWLDGYRNHADVTVVMPHRSFAQDWHRWFDMLNELAAANVSYRIVLAGDELVDCPLTAAVLQDCRVCLIPERESFLPADAELVHAYAASHATYTSVSDVLSVVAPAVRTKADGVVRALPRIAAGSVVVHLLNYGYDVKRDDVTPIANVEVQVDLQALGVAGATTCELLARTCRRKPYRSMTERSRYRSWVCGVSSCFNSRGLVCSWCFRRLEPSLLRFLEDLRDNNNRQWFQANKGRYEREVLEPCLAFIRAFGPRLRKISPFFVASDERVGGSLMRVYRDTRFGKDKTPYKTNVGIQFRHELGRDVHAPGFYVHIEPEEYFLALGVWRPDRDSLHQIRQAILERPEQWKRALRAKMIPTDAVCSRGRQFEEASPRLSGRPPADRGLETNGLCGIARLGGRRRVRRGLPGLCGGVVRSRPFVHAVSVRSAERPLLIHPWAGPQDLTQIAYCFG